MWRSWLIYNILSDYEIMRIQFSQLFNAVACVLCCPSKNSLFISKPYTTMQAYTRKGVLRMLDRVWECLDKHIFSQKIYDDVN